MSTAIKISDELLKTARLYAEVENRSVTKQIEYWAKIGKVCKDNPDLSFEMIEGILLSLEEERLGLVEDYVFEK